MDSNLVKVIQACILHDMGGLKTNLFDLDYAQLIQCPKLLYLAKFKKVFDFKLATKRAVYVYIRDMCKDFKRIEGKFDISGMVVNCTVLKYQNRVILLEPQKKEAFAHLQEDKKARIHQILLANVMASIAEVDKFSIAYINIDNFDILEFMYDYNDDLYTYICDNMNMLFNALNSNIVPESKILEDYECSYCVYSDDCKEAHKITIAYDNIPRILTDVTDDQSIREIVKKSIKAEGHNYAMKDGEYRVSALPSCPRKLYYIKTIGGDSQDDELNRMDIGKAFHYYIQLILPKFYMLNKEQEVNFIDDVIKITGHYDLKLKEAAWCKIGDIKTANEFSFRWKVQRFDRYHYLQANAYSAICKEPKGSVLYVDITSFRLFEHEFNTSEKDFTDQITKVHMVEDCIKKKTPPACAAVNDKECKYCFILGTKYCSGDKMAKK